MQFFLDFEKKKNATQKSQGLAKLAKFTTPPLKTILEEVFFNTFERSNTLFSSWYKKFC